MRQCLVGLLNVTGHLLGYVTDRITCTGVKTIRKTSLGKFFAIYELSELIMYITHVRAKNKSLRVDTKHGTAFGLVKLFSGGSC